MKRSIFTGLALGLLLFVLGSQTAMGQTPCSYQVLTYGTYSPQVLDQALDNAKLDAYRKRGLQRTLVFDQGARVVLFSANELVQRGCPVNAQLAMLDNQYVDETRVFTVHPVGIIMEVTSKPTKE